MALSLLSLLINFLFLHYILAILVKFFFFKKKEEAINRLETVNSNPCYMNSQCNNKINALKSKIRYCLW